jgi:hypothetical protein
MGFGSPGASRPFRLARADPTEPRPEVSGVTASPPLPSGRGSNGITIFIRPWQHERSGLLGGGTRTDFLGFVIGLRKEGSLANRRAKAVLPMLTSRGGLRGSLLHFSGRYRRSLPGLLRKPRGWPTGWRSLEAPPMRKAWPARTILAAKLDSASTGMIQSVSRSKDRPPIICYKSACPPHPFRPDPHACRLTICPARRRPPEHQQA